MQNQFVSSGFTCTSCEITFHVTVLEKMQHMQGEWETTSVVLWRRQNIKK